LHLDWAKKKKVGDRPPQVTQKKREKESWRLRIATKGYMENREGTLKNAPLNWEPRILGKKKIPWEIYQEHQRKKSELGEAGNPKLLNGEKPRQYRVKK